MDSEKTKPLRLVAAANNNNTWRMTSDSTLPHSALGGGARVEFPTPAAAGTAGGYHTPTMTGTPSGLTGALGGMSGTPGSADGASGGATSAFAMHADIAAGAADLLTINGPASGAHPIQITN
ncbi:MAG: hypothetical protein LBI02_00360 [Opitutaceae bacterium]|jgi:hypothetical protein|nr:hypothetical protein [Opitutaceae bacterium]